MLLSSYSCNILNIAWSWWPENFNSNNQLKEVVFTLSIFGLFCYLTSKWSHSKSARQKLQTTPLPPGPSGLPSVGNLPFLDPTLHTYLTCLSQTYGPIMKLRLGKKTTIVVSSTSAAVKSLKTVTSSSPTTTDWWQPLLLVGTYDGCDLTWGPYGPQWRTLRKVCTLKMLSNTTLNSVYPLHKKMVRQTVQYLYSQAGLAINVGDQAFMAAFNVVTSMIWGNTLKGEEMARLGAEFRQVITEMTVLVIKPNISDFYLALAQFDLQGIVKRMKVLANRFDSLFNMVIAKRLQMDEEGWNQKVSDEVNPTQDFLRYLLRLKEGGDSDVDAPFPMTQLKAVLLDMVAGGTETNSNSVEFAMAEMIKNPGVMSQAQQELEQVVGKDNIVEESHIQHLPYSKAVMMETLRLHPGLPFLVPHCPSETCVVGGYTVLKGSQVLINTWAIHRNPSNWKNPSNFDPERFTGTDSRWDFNGNDLNYVPFRSGHRIYPGTAMGERMVLYSLATFMHSFEWKQPGGSAEKLDVSERFGIVLKKKEPLVVIPTPRLSDRKMSIRLISTSWMYKMFPKLKRKFMKLLYDRRLARVE